MPIPGRHPRATESDLARLADGTLEPGRRQVVEKVVAASGELQARLREQRRAVEAVRGVSGERASLGAQDPPRARLAPPARSRPRLLGLGLAGVVGALAWSLATLGGGQAVLTVADAAMIAARPATAMVAEPVDDTSDASASQRRRAPIPVLGGRLRLASHRRPPRRRRRASPDHGLLPPPRPADRVHDRPRHVAARGSGRPDVQTKRDRRPRVRRTAAGASSPGCAAATRACSRGPASPSRRCSRSSRRRATARFRPDHAFRWARSATGRPAESPAGGSPRCTTDAGRSCRACAAARARGTRRGRPRAGTSSRSAPRAGPLRPAARARRARRRCPPPRSLPS